MVYKAGQIDADCMELTSYEKLVATAKAQINEGVDEILMYVDTGGGEAYSCFESAKEVRQYADANDVKIFAYVDGLSASAGYAWTSIADEIIVNPQAEVGSVGVVVQLLNNSKMLENIGITRQFVYNGDQKIPFEANGEFSEKFLSNIQKKVDKIGLEFNTFIANNRGLSVDSVIATQAEVFDADEALKVGFIDKIMTRSEFFNDYLPNANSQTNTQFQLNTEDNMTQKNDNVTVEELQAQLTTEKDTATNLQASLTEALGKNTELQTSLDSVQAELSTLKASYQTLLDETAEKEKLSLRESRKATLAGILGKDNPSLDALVTSFEALSDENFAMVAQSYGATVESNAQKMEELGDQGQQSDNQNDIANQIASFTKNTKQ